MKFSNSDTWDLALTIYMYPSWNWQKQPPVEIIVRNISAGDWEIQINLVYGIGGFAMIAPVFL